MSVIGTYIWCIVFFFSFFFHSRAPFVASCPSGLDDDDARVSPGEERETKRYLR